MNQLTVTQVSSLAATTKDVCKNDKDAFLIFYTNGQPEKIFVPMADFLEWKGVSVKTTENPSGPVSARAWTILYREIATSRYNNDSEMFLKKSVSDALLFDLDFLIEGFPEVRDMMATKVLGC